MLWDVAQSPVSAAPFIALVAALSSSLALLVAATQRRRPALRPDEIARRANALLSLGASPEVADALAHGYRINAIKAYREERGVGLREAKDAVDRLYAAARIASLAAAGISPRVAESLARGEKIAAIKAYREEQGVGLREAKAAVERLEWPR